MSDSKKKTRRRVGSHHTRSPLAERGADLYETPPEATQALLRVDPQLTWHYLNIWEPACGRGAITRVLENSKPRHAVHSSDLEDYDAGYIHGRDFLHETSAPVGTDAIVTNPPYKLAGEFAQHAIDLVPRVYLLLRLAMIEGERKKFRCFDDGSLRKIYVFKKRLPFMHRDGYTGKKNPASGMAFGWFCWDRAHIGPTTITRIDW